MSEKDDELAGFRDFLDADKDLKQKASSNKNSKHAGFELLSFLERESARLDKQLKTLEEKSYTLKNCDSFEKLNKEINREISLKSAELTTLLYRPDSPMMKSLREIFRSLFNGKS